MCGVVVRVLDLNLGVCMCEVLSSPNCPVVDCLAQILKPKGRTEAQGHTPTWMQQVAGLMLGWILSLSLSYFTGCYCEDKMDEGKKICCYDLHWGEN